ncbi:MAG: ribokinase [Phycisphaerales bacterium]|nr:ribokinase [Phycisphaerales bacterium]
MVEPAAQARICVIGSINMDLVVRAPRLPVAGETILGTSFRRFPGGKGANQAVAARRMGAAVAMVGCVGEDAHGRELRGILEREGISVDHVQVREGAATGVGAITVADGGENSIVVVPGANASLTTEDVQRAKGVIEQADVLLAQLEVPLSCVLAAAMVARAAEKTFILNAAPARPLSSDLLKLVDVLVVNRTEASTLSGLDAGIEPARLALRLAENGPPAVVLTLGPQGAIVAYKGRPKRVQTLHVQAVDAVGAGDAFAGALAVEWVKVRAAIKSRNPDEFRLVEEALAVASAAGALATTKAGAIPSLPKAAQVVEAMRAAGWQVTSG